MDPEFSGFVRRDGCFPLTYVCMTQYDAAMPNVDVAFRPQSLKNTLGEYISDKGMTQLRIAETEKVRPCDLLLQRRRGNGVPGEDRVLIHSPRWPPMTSSRR